MTIKFADSFFTLTNYITRTFFAFAKGKKIYILRTFVKKQQRRPQ
ncbi:type II toxin-antitoxin system RelE/ParE family toxin [Xenorhabdus sp. PR6a]|nr:type II toxin-antitoxin system RelE/ParE family toxin [Xenorhabdus sp. PR6a]MDC9581813.1 type II toxin-antitoxin system RelE/ParE family toxin [Xenorhabdus sp. PR6a]